MAFFQDLGKKISNVTQDAARKTSELIEISKLNSSINAEKSAIAELHKKIGVTVYSLYTTGEPIPDALAADVQGITAHLKTIDDLENKIADIKAEEEKSKADAAAASAAPATETPAQAAQPTEAAQPAEAAPEAAAAPAPADPATRAAEPAAAAPQAKRFCTSCGAPLEPGVLFCGKCGAKAG
jgi:hypothetical protein